MDALLIIGGLLLILAGCVWLICLAFGTSLFWGVGSLLPPVTLLYVVRHWCVARKAIVLAALGVIPLVVGLSMLANHEPERLATIFSLEWLSPPAPAENGLSMSIDGQLNGSPFNPRHGELTGNVLTLREGADFFANQAVIIRLAEVVDGALQVDVLPQDSGSLPGIEISWKDPDQPLPEARRIARGYTLHLDLQPVPPNKLAGDFHLVLPARYDTQLSGRVELYTDDLRYQSGEVDRRHDSRDTLAYVARDYLQRRYTTHAVQLDLLQPVIFPTTQVALNISATISGEKRNLKLPMSKGPEGWTVEGDEYPPLPQKHEQASAPKAVTVPEGAVQHASAESDRRHGFSLERLVREPSRYKHLLVRAHTERGSVAEGRFIGMDEDGNLHIQRIIQGPGDVRYSLSRSDIVFLELLEP